MLRETPVRRVIVVVLDGLRPDAIPRFGLHHIGGLVQRGAGTMLGRTVSPSVTACAMASLFTGAAPERHGLQSERFHLPRATGQIDPLPRLLAAHGLPTQAFLRRMPLLFVGIAHQIAKRLGVTKPTFRGETCQEILDHATPALRGQAAGLLLMHWPDCDRIGHEHGWMSEPYAEAARQMDAAMGRLLAALDLQDPGTLLIALADHGGGGAVKDHHNSEHPLDRTIPIVLAGGAVRRGDLPAGTSLLDVPATIAWALGLPIPDSFAGRPLRAALETIPLVAAA